MLKMLRPHWWLLAVLVEPGANGHEIPVHLEITRAAVQYLGMHDPRFACQSTKEKLIKLLQVGTAHEDDKFGQSIFFPQDTGTDFPLTTLGRYYFHFMPRLEDGGSSGSCDSVKWGVKPPSPCIAAERFVGTEEAVNNVGLDAAIANRSTLLGWHYLGYVLHLLQDLTSPAHTRNDRHPHLFDGSTFPDADPVEYYVNDDFQKGKLVLPLMPSDVLATPPFIESTCTFSFGECVEMLFRSLQIWVSSNFYSTDTTDQSGPSVTESVPPQLEQEGAFRR